MKFKKIYCENCKYFGTYLGSASRRCIKPKPYIVENYRKKSVVIHKEGWPENINKNNNCADFQEYNGFKWLRDLKSMFV